jgi:hypothetical protein
MPASGEYELDSEREVELKGSSELPRMHAVEWC